MQSAKRSSPRGHNLKQERYATAAYYGCLVLVTVLALLTRLHQLEEPAHIAWDETHFGKFASFYINRTFFFDVHPPLGKMAIALAGHLSGYNGSFAFKQPMDKYGDTPYYGMRLMCAICGLLCIPLAFLVVTELVSSPGAGLLGSLLIVFDTGCLTLSQYILLDPILMLFIMCSVFCMSKLDTLHASRRWFTVSWWVWCCLCGVSISCAMSVKWVGLFVVLLVGLHTIYELWDLLGDIRLSMFSLCKHVAARAVSLVFVPILVYLFWFVIHFMVLRKSGSGDAFFTSAFQSTLEGNEMANYQAPPEIAYGSKVTLRNQRTAGGLLHSHPHIYPEGIGAQQQQVTTYHHRDYNNEWLIKPAHQAVGYQEKPVLVRSGDLVRLEHVSTRRNLHSHYHKAPLTPRHRQVTCYGFNGTGDWNDVWQISVVGGREGDTIRILETPIRFIHNNTLCALHSENKQLPKWGWEQMEVSCTPKPRTAGSMWKVEGHVNEKLPNVTIETLQPSLLRRIIESHVIMGETNNQFKPKENELTSRPWMWPINYRGQVFSSGREDSIRVYLLGNPVVWWACLSFLGAFIVLSAAYFTALQRGLKFAPHFKEECNRLICGGSWLLLGWLLHYLPFFLMGRVLYFHHYFPAFLFSAMLAGIVFDYLCRLGVNHVIQSNWLTAEVAYSSVYTLAVAVIAGSFALFYPLSYGMLGPLSSQKNSTMYGLRWLSSWEF